LFASGRFLKIAEVNHIFATYFNGKGYAIILAKLRWATFGAIFFTNSSGHPA
jgi:hypothetical protein